MYTRIERPMPWLEFTTNILEDRGLLMDDLVSALGITYYSLERWLMNGSFIIDMTEDFLKMAEFLDVAVEDLAVLHHNVFGWWPNIDRYVHKQHAP